MPGRDPKKMPGEFQEFIAKANVTDVAAGVIIGGAFGLIVSSSTDDIIMPIVGAIFGGLDCSNYFLPLASGFTADTLTAAREQGGELVAVSAQFDQTSSVAGTATAIVRISSGTPMRQ